MSASTSLDSSSVRPMEAGTMTDIAKIVGSVKDGEKIIVKGKEGNNNEIKDPSFAAMRKRRQSGHRTEKRRKETLEIRVRNNEVNLNNSSLLSGCYSSGSSSSGWSSGGSSSEGEDDDGSVDHARSQQRSAQPLRSAPVDAPNNKLQIESSKESDGCTDSAVRSQKSNDLDNKKLMNNKGRTDHQAPQGETVASSMKDDSNPGNNKKMAVTQEQSIATNQPTGWRVKLYRLNVDGSWDDCGTGRISCTFTEATHATSKEAVTCGDIQSRLGDPVLCVRAEMPSHKLLLSARVLERQTYNRQGDNIITWCEPYYVDKNSNTSNDVADDKVKRSEKDESSHHSDNGVDLALSFQDNAGCLEIWKIITDFQTRATDRQHERVISPTKLTSSDIPEKNSSNYDRSDNESTNDTSKDLSCDGNEGINESSSTSIALSDGSNNISSLRDVDAIELAANQILPAQQHSHQLKNHTLYARQQKHSSFDDDDDVEDDSCYGDTETAAVSMAAVAAAAFHNRSSANPNGQANTNSTIDNNNNSLIQLPTPTLSNIEQISDIVAASHTQTASQRESLSLFISNNDCKYLKDLLSLFPSAELKDDFGILATLAACIKSILLLNDPSIVEVIAMDAEVFENVCSALEYDPDLRVKANHRWFLRERVKFKTVARMDDEDLVSSIHRAFRVNYLRDTLLRPTMDESSLSTLTSLLQFTHGDVVRRVSLCTTVNSSFDDSTDKKIKQDSFLVKVLKVMGNEVKAIKEIESEYEKTDCQQNQPSEETNVIHSQSARLEIDNSSSFSNEIVNKSNLSCSTQWTQHLLPQDASLKSRKIRRQGCLAFLRELFNMVRIALQQSAKDDYYNMVVFMDINLNDADDEDMAQQPQPDNAETGKTNPDKSLSKTENELNESSVQNQDVVSLLSLLSAILSDPKSEVSDRCASIEILSAIAMHDPSLIRRHCLMANMMHAEDETYNPGRPEPNEDGEALFICGSNDLLLCLLYLMAVETDAGILLQTSEIIRIILDNEISEQGPFSGCTEDESSSVSCAGSSEQNQFLALFYEHYVQWLVAPFQYTILVSHVAVQPGINSNGKESDRNTRSCSKCSIRFSFAIELLCFCVRAHCFRMKIYVIKNRVLVSVLKLLHNKSEDSGSSVEGGGNRCLQLASLRLFRSVISVKDEFYHRHIIQYNLFSYVFDAFRSNPVGDNLVSSAIIELCDFIRNENIKSLVDHIVNKHLSVKPSIGESDSAMRSLDDVETFSLLRRKYENNMLSINGRGSNDDNPTGSTNENGSSMSDYILETVNGRGARIGMSQKALEDQRKFRENDEEDSYFSSDSDECEQTRIRHTSSQLGSTHIISSVNDKEDDLSITRSIRLGLSMVNYSSSSDEDDDDSSIGDKSDPGIENCATSQKERKRNQSDVERVSNKRQKMQLYKDCSETSGQCTSKNEDRSSNDVSFSHSDASIVLSTSPTLSPGNIMTDLAKL